LNNVIAKIFYQVYIIRVNEAKQDNWIAVGDWRQ